MKNSPDGDRQKAEKLYAEGNFNEALQLYCQLWRDPAAQPSTIPGDWQQTVSCLARLQRNHELDALLEEMAGLHSGHWQALQAAAQTLLSTESYGFLTAGRFYRGQGRGGGEWVQSAERDRVRALQLLLAGVPLVANEPVAEQRGQYFQVLARAISQNRATENQWRLQELTDCSVLPDYEEPRQMRYGWGWSPAPARGAPVDADGNPVLYKVPESWEAAANDGERWRWALAQSEKNDPALRPMNQWTWLQFLQDQFGVQTLAEQGINLMAAEADVEDGAAGGAGNGQRQDPRENPLALRTLTDDETIARLATGVRRFKLPPEHNPIRIAQSLADLTAPEWAAQSLEFLARVYADRQQFPVAARHWQQVIERFGRSEYRTSELNQIIRPWGMFEPARVFPAGEGAQLEYRFRNGKSVALEARVIDQQRLMDDAVKYLSTSPRDLDWQRSLPAPSGGELLEEPFARYVGEKVAEWTVELQPRPAHFDRRVTISTPLQKAGLYLVTARLKDGNQTHIVVAIDDLMLLRKPVNGQSLYFLADAATGAPMPGAEVEFFGWNNVWNERLKRSEIVTRRFAERSDQDGLLAAEARLMENGMQWLARARTPDGRRAWMGYSWIWNGVWNADRPERAQAYLITDRPIYRPGQRVHFRAWVREASYKPAASLASFAGEQFTLIISDPQGVEVRRENIRLDENGSFSGDLELPPQAGLGSWQINLHSTHGLQRWGQVGGAIAFRVEEYRKPEFEVTIDTPEAPVRLGETITARLRASYYFGGPVINATIRYKVHRQAKETRWYPVRQWDWLYGNGYWWFSGDAAWYPGFARWGCRCPVQPWWGWEADPPELVLDEETAIGPDGTAEIRIDTSLALALHPDDDHEYTISAEVTDSSRRTITGSGSVTVSRQPFRVYCWTDAGYSRVGEKFTARFSARAPGGSGVAGRATVELFKVTWNDQGEPDETLVESWPGLAVSDDGQFEQVMNAAEAGQYRIVGTLDDGNGNRIRGAQLLTVIGAGFDGSGFRFGDLEITTDKAEYAPGDQVRLMINTNRTGGTVLLWLRPSNGVYAGRPQLVRLKGKSTIVEVDVTADDMPNFFVEATTVSGARLHEVLRNIVVPPSDKSLTVTIQPSSTEYLPGAEAKLDLLVTDSTGEPVAGDLVLTMYDRAIEYISGGSNVTDLREFFWKWTRTHHPFTEHSLARVFGQFARPGDTTMQFLGVFGRFTADQDMDGLLENAKGAPGNAMRQGQILGRGGGMGGSGRMEAMAMEAAPMMAADAAGGAPPPDDEQPMAAAVVRSNFADSAVWRNMITAGPDGRATLTFQMPENLTAWKIRSWAMGPATSVGEAAGEVTTRKNILVRLQAPRFFVERDEVVLSAIVHNYLPVAKTARVSLALSGDVLTPLSGDPRTIEVPAGGDVRVDWLVRATGEGTAAITMLAETDAESDAMKMEFPVRVHGILRTESFSRMVRSGQESATIEFQVPAERRPEQTRLEVRFSPTLAGAMVDALPYLVDYPWGCTEQTLNRFVPTVITLNVLRRMNLDLDAIREKRTNLNAQELGDPAQRAARWKTPDRNPVFDPAEVERMVKQGVSDLTAMQCSDGGWGWFSGFGERSWPHTTAVVVHGLQTAVAADVAIPADVLARGVQWLRQYEEEQVRQLDEWERIRDLPQDQWPRNRSWKQVADNLDALVHRVLTDADAANGKMRDYLYRDRTRLTLYGMGLLGLALDQAGDAERRDMVIRNISQFVKVDEENQTAFIDLPNNNAWWYWYGDTIEANACWLKLMARTSPDDPRTSGVVKYLLNNRRLGSRWNSTRDTAACIEALAEYLVRSGEDAPEMTVEVVLDGTVRRTVEINRENLFSFDNAFLMAGEGLETGSHVLELRRKGKGPLYASAWLGVFTLEDSIPPAGLEIRVNRQVFRLVQRADATASVAGSRGQVVDQAIEKYDRIPLADLAEVNSGDLILVELEVDSKNDYEYVIFEDFKAAGFEPVELQSGYTAGGLGAYVEFRDERVAFFLRNLARGKHSFSYRLRAETPGRFSALPAMASAMYAPELRGNSGEIRLVVAEAELEAGKEK